MVVTTAPTATPDDGTTADGSGDEDVSPLLAGLPNEFDVWMSHGDKLHEVPTGFRAVGESIIYYLLCSCCCCSFVLSKGDVLSKCGV